VEVVFFFIKHLSRRMVDEVSRLIYIWMHEESLVHGIHSLEYRPWDYS
jgi:hypothetical protein